MQWQGRNRSWWLMVLGLTSGLWSLGTLTWKLGMVIGLLGSVGGMSTVLLLGAVYGMVWLVLLFPSGTVFHVARNGFGWMVLGLLVLHLVLLGTLGVWLLSFPFVWVEFGQVGSVDGGCFPSVRDSDRFLPWDGYGLWGWCDGPECFRGNGVVGDAFRELGRWEWNPGELEWFALDDLALGDDLVSGCAVRAVVWLE